MAQLSVEWAFGLVKLPNWCRSFNLAIFLLLASAGLENLMPLTAKMPLHLQDALWLVAHPLWGLAFFCLLNHFVHAESVWQQSEREPRWATTLAAVGLFSYSLYLVHELILMQMYRFWILGQSWLVISLFVMIPLALAGSWVFFWLCERPFLNPPK